MFHSNYGPILYHFRYKARCWCKIATFHTHLHSTPPLGGSPSEYCHKVGLAQKKILELCGYPTGKKFDDTFSCFDTIPACDRRTDGQIDVTDG